MTTTLLTEHTPLWPAGTRDEDGEFMILGGNRFAALETPVEWNEHCYACHRWSRFVALSICLEGHVCECSGCGDVRVRPLERTNSEVA